MIKTPHKPENYAIVCNEVAQRTDLSARAKGIYYYLATLPHDWELSKKEMRTHFTEGRDAIDVAFKELVDTGYISMTTRFDDNGKLAGKKYQVFWTSNSRNTDFPSDGDSRGTEKQPLQSKEDNKVNIKQSIYTFDQFWNTYDKKTSKHPCEKKYSKINETDRSKIKDALPWYIATTPDKQYRKNPLTWLNQRCWEDEISVSPKQRSVSNVKEW